MRPSTNGHWEILLWPRSWYRTLQLLTWETSHTPAHSKGLGRLTVTPWTPPSRSTRVRNTYLCFELLSLDPRRWPLLWLRERLRWRLCRSRDLERDFRRSREADLERLRLLSRDRDLKRTQTASDSGDGPVHRICTPEPVSQTFLSNKYPERQPSALTPPAASLTTQKADHPQGGHRPPGPHATNKMPMGKSELLGSLYKRFPPLTYTCADA